MKRFVWLKAAGRVFKIALTALVIAAVVIVGLVFLVVYVWPLSPYQLFCNAEQAQNPYFSCLITTL